MIEGADLSVAPGAVAAGVPPSPAGRLAARARRGDIRPVAAWILMLALFFTYASLQSGVISNAQIGTLCADTLPLVTLALGEGLVIITAGIDLSV
ncbi:MAG TPA: hypothetical protein VMS00_11650, partial [Acidimicrobiales bacterium]|nr:hypothetical protein [Acidimicrobiales bacterium]